MFEELLIFLKTPSLDQLLPLLPLLVLGITCLILGLRGSKWKKRYNSLSDANLILEERLAIEQQQREDRESLLQEAAASLKYEFKDLAHQIFDEKSRTFSSQNREKLDFLLTPFREQINSFRDRVDVIFVEETRERASLKQEILHLRELNQQINEEARNLTMAIGGTSQSQGAWGELVLENRL